MGIISNIVQTVFTSKGAEKVKKDTKSIGRAQNRLAQESASAGRSFSAQSTGLGGLVGAYAGAAATVFAITAAFTALNKAAENENIIKGTNALAAEVGQSGPAILSVIREITQGQLSLAESAQNANIALSAGFNTKQLEGVTRVAMRASRALGRNLTDSMQRVIRGAAKLEPELLDELGIFVRIQPAAKAYARQLGVSVKSLSNFEKRQAFVNAMIAEGDRKFSSINVSSASAQKSLQKLATQVLDMASSFGQLLANVVTPLVDFITNDVGNAFLAFGILGAVVFNKAATMIAGSFNKMTEGAIKWSEGLSKKAAESKGSFAIVEKGVVSLKKSISDSGGRMGSFMTKGMKGSSVELAKEAAAIRKNFMNGDVTKMSTPQMKSDVKKLRAVRSEMFKLKSSIPANRMGSFNAAIKSSSKIISTYERAISSAGKKAKFFDIVTAGMTKTLKGVASVAAFAGSALNKMFIAFSVLQIAGSIFGIDFIKEIKNWFVDNSQAAADFKNGFIGAMTAAAGGVGILNDKLKELGANKDQIANFADTYMSVSNGINNRLRHNGIIGELARSQIPKARNARDNAKLDTIIAGGSAAAADSAGVIAYNKSLEATKALWGNIVHNNFPTYLKLEEARSQLLIVNASLSKETNQEDIAVMKIRQLAIQTLISSLQKYNGMLDQFAGRIATLTGLSSIDVFAVLDSRNIAVINNELTLFGDLVLRAGDNGVISFDSLNENQKKLVSAWFIGISTMNKVSEAYDAGATSADKMSAAISGARSQLLEQKDAAEAMKTANIAGGMSIDQATSIYKGYISSLEEAINKNVVLRDGLQRIENTFKSVSSIFSKDINVMNNLAFKGLIDSSGEFATSQVDINRNQQEVLASVLDTNKASYDLSQTGAKLNQGQINQAELYSTTLKAIVGIQLNSIMALNTIVKKETDRTAQIEKQLALQEQSRSLTNLTNYLTLQEAISTSDIAAQKSASNLATTRLATDQARYDLIKKQAQASIDLSSNTNLSKSDIAKRRSSISSEVRSLMIQIDSNSVKHAAESINSVVNSPDAHKAQKDLINTDAEVKKAFINDQLAIFDLETSRLADEWNATVQKKQDEIVLITAKANLGKVKIQANIADNRAKAEIVKAQIKGYSSFAKGVQGFANSVVDLSVILSDYVKSDPRLKGTITKLAKRDISGQVAASSASATTALSTSTNAQDSLLQAQIKAINEDAALRIAAVNEQIKSLYTTGATDYATRMEKRAQLNLQLQRVTDDAATAVAGLTGAVGGSGGSGGLSDAMKKVKSLFDSIEGAFNSALMGLNDLVFYGTGDFRDIMSSLFKSIQQDFFKVTIADPASKFLTDYVGKLFGVKRGINSVELVKGAVPVVAADMTGPFNLIGKRDKGDKSVLEGMFGKDSTIGNFFKKIFGEGGFFSSLFKGIGSIFSSNGSGGGILSFIGKILGGIFGGGKASGVGKAAGGAIQQFASGGNIRDRVSILAEPGEFMLRKPVAKAIGAPALHELNATGNIGGKGNVQVNIVNTGTAQDAQVSVPKFDGKKFIIDIVTKDIANNGPIRRSLRGGM